MTAQAEYLVPRGRSAHNEPISVFLSSISSFRLSSEKGRAKVTLFAHSLGSKAFTVMP